ncbi:MAG: hypothetical protein CM15mP6_0940 [Methanobacteriota archaeon]|nr:MAG: hypothetical protein CM15mP6_0940 [Euryarchaeota archaeon]
MGDRHPTRLDPGDPRGRGSHYSTTGGPLRLPEPEPWRWGGVGGRFRTVRMLGRQLRGAPGGPPPGGSAAPSGHGPTCRPVLRARAWVPGPPTPAHRAGWEISGEEHGRAAWRGPLPSEAPGVRDPPRGDRLRSPPGGPQLHDGTGSTCMRGERERRRTGKMSKRNTSPVRELHRHSPLDLPKGPGRALLKKRGYFAGASPDIPPVLRVTWDVSFKMRGQGTRFHHDGEFSGGPFEINPNATKFLFLRVAGVSSPARTNGKRSTRSKLVGGQEQSKFDLE